MDFLKRKKKKKSQDPIQHFQRMKHVKDSLPVTE